MRGLSQNVTHAKKYCSNNGIKIYFSVVIHRFKSFFIHLQLQNTFYVENMHILVDMRPKIRSNCRLLFSSKFVTFGSVKRG